MTRSAIVLLAAISVSALLLIPVSVDFAYGTPIADRPIELLVGILCLQGALFLLFARQVLRVRIAPSAVGAALALGLLVRVGLFFSGPILETDFYRYLWDGAVTAQWENPYRPIPREVIYEESPLGDLARESNPVVWRINHPHLRTIYPPVSQVFFAAAYIIQPWSLNAWRLVILLADVAALGLLLLVLREAKLPAALSLLYWWNPLVFKEYYNAAHMDVLLAPFLLGAMLLACRRQLAPAVLVLAAATGVKLWPVLLLPLLLRVGGVSLRHVAAATGVYAFAVAAIHIPVYTPGLDSTSGFVAYAGGWEMNNGPYLLFLAAGRAWEGMSGMEGSARTVASGIAGGIVLAVVALACRRPVGGLADMGGRALAIVAALFLVSPTQFPWYSLWFLPFLALRPHFALMFYALTLPLYYLRFRYQGLGIEGVFDHWVVWVEHGPVLLLLAATLLTRTREDVLPALGVENGPAEEDRTPAVGLSPRGEAS